MKFDTKEWSRCVSLLRKHLPPPDGKVHVRRCTIDSSCLGWCTKQRGHYFVRVSSSIPDIDLAKTILCHEWAHARVWNVGIEAEGDHGPHWGIEFARAYRLLYDSEE